MFFNKLPSSWNFPRCTAASCDYTRPSSPAEPRVHTLHKLLISHANLALMRIALATDTHPRPLKALQRLPAELARRKGAKRTSSPPLPQRQTPSESGSSVHTFQLAFAANKRATFVRRAPRVRI